MSTLPPTGQRPLCLSCKKELRPNFDEEPAPYAIWGDSKVSERIQWKKDHPKVWKGTYGRYGDSRFCGLSCGYSWALRHTIKPV